MSNQIQAQILKSYLESQGVKVFMKDEALGAIYGLSSGPLAEVDLLVFEDQLQEAERLLEEYQEDEGFHNI